MDNQSISISDKSNNHNQGKGDIITKKLNLKCPDQACAEAPYSNKVRKKFVNTFVNNTPASYIRTTYK